MEWVLVIFLYGGLFADSKTSNLTTIGGFTTKEACETSAKKSKSFAQGSGFIFRYTCVEVK